MKVPLRTKSGKIVVRKGKPKIVSPESYFIRMGKFPKRVKVNGSRAKRLGARFLSKVWHDTAIAAIKPTPERNKNLPRNSKTVILPLPTFKQRLYGGKLSKSKIVEIDGQINFAVNTFCPNFSPQQKANVVKKVKESITNRILSINHLLREKTRTDIKQMRIEGKELYNYLRNKGEIYVALMQELTGKTYFSKGWNSDKVAGIAPIHETIHILQKLGLIKIDVPFAEAIDRVYGLENGLLRIEKNMRDPSVSEFDFKARIDKKVEAQMKEKGKLPKEQILCEADSSYSIGDRIGQWIYLNLSKEKRWNYLYQRCMGKSHTVALENIGFFRMS